MGLTDESVDRIWELVALDWRVVSATLREGSTKRAWEYASYAYDKRRPLIAWLLEFRRDRARLRFLEAACNCSALKQLSPNSFSDLLWEKQHLERQLDKQRSRLSLALWALRPELEQRVITAARETPGMIPSVSGNVLKSSSYWLRWEGNKWLRKIRSPEGFQRTREQQAALSFGPCKHSKR